LRDLSDSPKDRMNVHKNARLTPLSRAELLRRVAAEGVDVKTVRTWVSRFVAEGSEGLLCELPRRGYAAGFAICAASRRHSAVADFAPTAAGCRMFQMSRTSSIDCRRNGPFLSGNSACHTTREKEGGAGSQAPGGANRPASAPNSATITGHLPAFRL
jgi:hypothetical protein